jgi:hypothetical protein
MSNSIDIYKYYSEMEENNILLAYKGEITSKVLTSLLDIVEQKLDSLSEAVKIKKTMFNVLVECLQNLYHHTEEFSMLDMSNSRLNHVMIMIKKDTEEYLIMTGNYMLSSKVDGLKAKIDKVNGLDKEELRVFGSKVLAHDGFSEKGGAGLGLIDMARKTGQKLGYEFLSINDQFSFFNLNLKVTNKS